jgi:serine/threonine protein kinase
MKHPRDGYAGIVRRCGLPRRIITPSLFDPDPGSRLGADEVIASIGKGGMGEVYRARDAKLNTDR